jgi:hypothetical protein
MFADAADAAVETISASSGNFQGISTPLWTVCRDLESATGELVRQRADERALRGFFG